MTRFSRRSNGCARRSMLRLNGWRKPTPSGTTTRRRWIMRTTTHQRRSSSRGRRATRQSSNWFLTGSQNCRCKMQGITINAEAIAKGLLAMIDDLPDADSYHAALAFGMLPGPLMECLNKALEAKARELVEEKIGARPDDSDATARECWDYLWSE